MKIEILTLEKNSDVSFYLLSGLDNKVTVFNVSNPEEDSSAKKKTVGTHTNFVSCCLFPHSDQQVFILILHKNECINVNSK